MSGACFVSSEESPISLLKNQPRILATLFTGRYITLGPVVNYFGIAKVPYALQA